MSEPMPMTETNDADARDAHEVAPDGVGIDDSGDGESVPGGDAGPTIDDLLSGEPSDTEPVTSGTYALYHATNGGLVLVLEDKRTGVKTIPIPKVVLAAMRGGGRRKLINPFALFGGSRG